MFTYLDERLFYQMQLCLERLLERKFIPDIKGNSYIRFGVKDAENEVRSLAPLQYSPDSCHAITTRSHSSLSILRS